MQVNPQSFTRVHFPDLDNKSISSIGILLASEDGLETTRRYCEPSPHDLALAVGLIGEEE